MKNLNRYVDGAFWSTAIFAYGVFKPLLIFYYSLHSLYFLRRKIYLSRLSSFLFAYIICWFPYIVFLANFSALSNYLAFILAFVFYYSVRESSADFLRVIFYIAIFACCDAFFQFVNGVDFFGNPLYAGARATGPFTWPSPVIGSYIAVLFLLPILFLKSRFLQFIVMALSLFTVLISGNRSNILQIMLVGFLFLNMKARLLIVLVITMVAIFYEQLLVSLDMMAVIRVLDLISIEKVIALETEPGRRLHMWQHLAQNIDIFTFLFGSGFGASELYIENVYPFGYQHPHHLYLEIFLNLGFVAS